MSGRERENKRLKAEAGPFQLRNKAHIFRRAGCWNYWDKLPKEEVFLQLLMPSGGAWGPLQKIQVVQR